MFKKKSKEPIPDDDDIIPAPNRSKDANRPQNVNRPRRAGANLAQGQADKRIPARSNGQFADQASGANHDLLPKASDPPPLGRPIGATAGFDEPNPSSAAGLSANQFELSDSPKAQKRIADNLTAVDIGLPIEVLLEQLTAMMRSPVG